LAYRARIGHLKFRENPSAYWNVRNPNLSAVAAVSTEVKRYLESFRFLPARNVRVLHHGINRAWVDPQRQTPYPLRRQLGIPDNALIVASMAILRRVKRFEFVVHAARKLREHPVHFVHIGDPRGWDRRTPDLPHIHFLGQQPHPIPILAAADVFAMVTHNEAFGRATLEAMACGKPVIGSNTGGLLDLVVPGKTGELFDTTSPDDFAACIEKYLRRRERVVEHGRNALARVDAMFTTENMLTRYLDLYSELLAARAT
jgi:glycosyltransferase involved in cell wall biosynthesis